MIRLFLTVFAFLLAAHAAAAADCAPRQFEGADYTVCRVDLATEQLALYNLDRYGEPYGSFSALQAGLASQGKSLTFAMNAGMYDDNLKPIGLYVEEGKQAKAVNKRNGAGNFHLKPNGVFYLKDGKAGVADTESYLKLKIKPDFATQSGPMLVINGEVHPAFSPTGISMKRRNGVGIVDEKTVVFAISEGGVRFHDFARLFRDELGCKNALFFDGSISSLYSAELGRNDVSRPLGPIVAAVK
jgi:uncharacterized protein YigE (DUF2233 family)